MRRAELQASQVASQLARLQLNCTAGGFYLTFSAAFRNLLSGSLQVDVSGVRLVFEAVVNFTAQSWFLAVQKGCVFFC